MNTTTFIEREGNISYGTKKEYLKKHPNAKYSGKTIRDKEGNIIRKPGYYLS